MGLTREQLVFRKKGIGGSDVAAILGLSDYRDVIDIYKDKTSEEVVEREETEKMHWGNVLEAPIAEEYAKQTGNKIYTFKELFKMVSGRDPGPVDLAFKHPEHEFLMGNVDRFYETPDGRRGILEIKTTSKHYMSGWKYDLPLEYYCQVQHYMYITKALGVIQLDEAHVAILASGQEFTIIPVEYDQKYIDGAVAELTKFWNHHVQKKTPPEPTDGDQVEKLYTAMQDKEIEATGEVMALINNLAETNQKMSELKKHKENLESGIKVIMKDAELLTFQNDLVATWKTVNQSKLDQKALEADYPDLITDYKKPSSYRKFLCKVKAEDNNE